MSGDRQQSQHGPYSKEGEQGHHGSSFPGKTGQKDDKKYRVPDRDEKAPAPDREKKPKKK